MIKVKYAFIALALATAACSPPGSETTQSEGAASPVLGEVAAAASAAAPGSFEPVRVIESTQTVDGSVVYELFRAAQSGSPSGGPDMEVRWHEGSAEMIP